MEEVVWWFGGLKVSGFVCLMKVRLNEEQLMRADQGNLLEYHRMENSGGSHEGLS